MDTLEQALDKAERTSALMCRMSSGCNNGKTIYTCCDCTVRPCPIAEHAANLRAELTALRMK
jgi:hypothetical protein